jgi:hypothetical protein
MKQHRRLFNNPLFKKVKMQLLNRRSGRLEMIIGCMYASKTSTLLSKIRQHKILGQSCLVVNHALDTR